MGPSSTFLSECSQQAFGEVSTALSAHQELANSLTQEARSARAYQESVRLANTRYDSGLANYFEVIDAKLDLYPVQQFEVQYDLERKIALVNLYMALGGGWKLSDADWTKSTVGGPAISNNP
jgi:multidrug efflux system outer membrane protein